MYEPFMYGVCPLLGCIYNNDGECMYNCMSIQDHYSCACYDEIYGDLMTEE